LKSLRTLVLLAVFSASKSLAAFGADSSKVLVTVELMKVASAPKSMPVTVEFPQSCSGCEIVHDDAYEKQNSRQIVLAMRVPRSTELRLTVKVPPSSIRRALIEGCDLEFSSLPGGLSFTLPAQAEDRVNSGEFQTHLLWPGIDLRFEHADPERRSGKYADGPWPAVERKAAANLEFAQREAARMLGLDSLVASQNIGTIDLMGFDTNYPHGHEDWPPHMHMILWWPTPKGTGSLVGHYYISPQGLLTDTMVGPIGAIGVQADFPIGKTFIDTDISGNGIYTHTVTREGWLRLGRIGGSECLIRPAGSGFQDGATVKCPGFTSRRVKVDDDVDKGILRAWVNDAEEIYHYDADCGKLLP
jgi:hypothetical protein